MIEQIIHPVIIIGAGPGGMTAAIYLKRANIVPKLIDKYAPGGKMNITQHIENYPGITKVSGPDLAFMMFEQIRSLGIEVDYGNVSSITKENEIFKVVTDEGELFAKAVIVATGTEERKLRIPGEAKYTGKGVSYCAICDGNLYKNDAIVLIGGGNSAIEEAVFLSKIVKQVYIVHRNENFKAEEGSIEILRNSSNVTFFTNSIPVEIVGDNDGVTGLLIKNMITGESQTLGVKAVFPFVGSDASTDFLSAFDVRDDKGFVIVNSEMSTNVPGLYSVGDVNAKVLRQIVTATSDGAIAALAANKFIKRKPVV